MTEEQKCLIAKANELNNHPALQDRDHVTIMGMGMTTEEMRKHVEDLRQRTQESGL